MESERISVDKAEVEQLLARQAAVETELAAAAAAFAIMRKSLELIGNLIFQHHEALQLIGPGISVLLNMNPAERDAANDQRAAEEVAELKKMFGGL